MGTVLDYLKEYGDYTLAEKPFCEVDSLILSQFSYLKFDGMLPEIDEILIFLCNRDKSLYRSGPTAKTPAAPPSPSGRGRPETACWPARRPGYGSAGWQ